MTAPGAIGQVVFGVAGGGGGGGGSRSVVADFQLLDLPTRIRLAATVLEETTRDYHRGAALARNVDEIVWSPANLRTAADQIADRAVKDRTAAALTRRLAKIHEANTSDLPAIVEAILADFDVTPKAGVQ